MFRGRFFSTCEPDLLEWTRELDDGVGLEFPDFLDDRAARRVVLRPDEFTGRGVCLADGVPRDHRIPVGFYHGMVRTWTPQDDYVLAVRTFRRGGSSWRLSLDAGSLCRRANPSPINVALYNHTCGEASVQLSWSRASTIPLALAFAPAGLPPGSRLRWNYDGLGRAAADRFTMSQPERDAWVLDGFEAAACACARPLFPCPRNRWFKIWPS